MERAEAGAIYDQGREAVVAMLLRMDEQIRSGATATAELSDGVAVWA